jgi:hypothetical protein
MLGFATGNLIQDEEGVLSNACTPNSSPNKDTLGSPCLAMHTTRSRYEDNQYIVMHCHIRIMVIDSSSPLGCNM